MLRAASWAQFPARQGHRAAANPNHRDRVTRSLERDAFSNSGEPVQGLQHAHPASLERTTGGPGRLASARNAAMRSVLRILLAVDCDALGRFSCLGGSWEDDGEHAVLE